MTRPYTLPDKLPGESDPDWCRRAVESIPAEAAAWRAWGGW